MRVGEALKQLVMKTYPFRSPYQDEGDAIRKYAKWRKEWKN